MAADDAADGIKLTVATATDLCERGLRQIGYSAEEACIIASYLVDAELCGYPSLGLARLLTIAEDPRAREPRRAIRIVYETVVRKNSSRWHLSDGNHCALRIMA